MDKKSISKLDIKVEEFEWKRASRNRTTKPFIAEHQIYCTIECIWSTNYCNLCLKKVAVVSGFSSFQFRFRLYTKIHSLEPFFAVGYCRICKRQTSVFWEKLQTDFSNTFGFACCPFQPYGKLLSDNKFKYFQRKQTEWNEAYYRKNQNISRISCPLARKVKEKMNILKRRNELFHRACKKISF